MRRGNNGRSRVMIANARAVSRSISLSSPPLLSPIFTLYWVLTPVISENNNRWQHIADDNFCGQELIIFIFLIVYNHCYKDLQILHSKLATTFTRFDIWSENLHESREILKVILSLSVTSVNCGNMLKRSKSLCPLSLDTSSLVKAIKVMTNQRSVVRKSD